MVSDLFFYELLLLSLLWLCVMLSSAGPSDRSAGDQRTSKPIPPPHKRSSARKPHCATCEQAAQGPAALPPAAPPPITSSRGRPRQVDTSRHFCPNPDCAYRGWVGWGNLSANGHPKIGRAHV